MIGDRSVGDHHACGVNGDVSRHSLKPHRRIHQRLYAVRAFIELLERGLGKGVGDGDVQLLRNGACHGVHVLVGHSKRPSHVADRGACGKRAEGDDLRHVIGAVFARDVVDDLVASVVAKVDIDIRHTDALGIEEALKEQVKANGIHVRNAQNEGHEASRPRASAGSYGNIARLCKGNVVLHDEKIVGVSHLPDDRKLVVNAGKVFLLRVSVIKEDLSSRNARFKPLKRQAAKRLLGRLSLGTGEFRQIRGGKIEFHVASLGNTAGILDRLGIGTEEHLHLVRILKVKLVRGKGGGTSRIHGGLRLNAHQHRLGLRVLPSEIVTVVGGHQGKPRGGGQIRKHGQNGLLLGHAVILQLNIEMILAKQLAIAHSGGTGGGNVTLGEQTGDPSAKAGRKRDQPFRVRAQKLLVHARLVVKALGIGARNHLDQVSVSRHILTEKHQMVSVSVRARRLVKARIRRNVDLTSDDGMHPCLAAGAVKGDHAVHGTVIGNGHRLLSAFLDPCGDLGDPTRAVEQAVFAMQVKMNEAVHPAPSLLLVQIFFSSLFLRREDPLAQARQ